MRTSFILVMTLFFVFCSCVPRAEYKRQQENNVNLINENYSLRKTLSLKNERILELETEIENLEANIEQLERDKEFYLGLLREAQQDMNDAYKTYHFWGPTHFFTESAINGLKQTFMY